MFLFQFNQTNIGLTNITESILWQIGTVDIEKYFSFFSKPPQNTF
jgi:hypothetical protein